MLEQWVSITTIAANIATVFGVASITIVVGEGVKEIAHAQARAIHQRENRRAPSNTDSVLLNTILGWAETYQQYYAGVSDAEFERMSFAERRRYINWLGTLIAAFDIGYVTHGASTAVTAKIVDELKLHPSAALTKGWLRKRSRFEVSADLQSLIVATARRA